ncbi:unnamed protein product [Polarella glacialis]|uniref:Uncharacterized protein n=1 Tax=Polarella glacialis TaxID=89957 RepID=A0A813IJZ1_POLGL|nr:unnamed protein product [Polarella glacialis]
MGQDKQTGGMVQELRRELTAETASRAAAWDQLRQDLQREVMTREELVTGATKSCQRAVAKSTEDWRSGLMAEFQAREDMRMRFEQQLSEARLGNQELRALADKREVDSTERIRATSEAWGVENRTRRGQEDQLQQGLDELRRLLAGESSERRAAADGLLVRLQNLEASANEEAALREESGRRIARDIVGLQARVQEERADREDSIARLGQTIMAEAAARDEGLVHETKAREEAVSFAAAAASKGLQAEKASNAEEQRSFVARLQQLHMEQQQEREERARVARDLNASVVKLQRLQAEEEDARAQEGERLGSAVEALQEAMRGQKIVSEEHRQRLQEASDELRGALAREGTVRVGKLDAMEATVKDLRSLLAAEGQKREAAVQGLGDEILEERQVREEGSGRERRSIEEEIARAVRELRKGREDDERRMQERLLELAGSVAEEREQRIEAFRMERLRTDDFKEELLTQRKACQRELDKFANVLKRAEDSDSKRTTDLEAQVAGLQHCYVELRADCSSEVKRQEEVWRSIEGRTAEVEALVRLEVKNRRVDAAETQQVLDAEATLREESIAVERRAREASIFQAAEMFKVAAHEERSQRSAFLEQTNKDFAFLKSQLAEEVSRREDERGHGSVVFQKLRTDFSELLNEKRSDTLTMREAHEQLQLELQEVMKLRKEDDQKVEAAMATLGVKMDHTARIAREQNVGLEVAVQSMQDEVLREADERATGLRRLEAKIGEERRQLEAHVSLQAKTAEDVVRAAEESSRQRIMEESRKSKASVDRISAQLAALAEDVEASRTAQPEQTKEFARGLAQLQKQLSSEELGRQQSTVALQRFVDSLRDDLTMEGRDRRAQLAVATDEVALLSRSTQQREDRSEVFVQQLAAELTELRERLSREARTRESAMLQLESRTHVAAGTLAVAVGSGQAAVTDASRSAAPSVLAVTGERWRQAEEEMERTRNSLTALKGEAQSLSKAMAGLDERCESVRADVGVVQGSLAEIQQRHKAVTEVEAQVVAAREELRREAAERRAEGAQLASRVVESAERLEWAEQQRLKAEALLQQDVMDTKAELQREIRDREESHMKVDASVREEAVRREEALEREARLRLEGEERAAYALQAAIREERRLRGQHELRLEDRALAVGGGTPQLALLDCS